MSYHERTMTTRTTTLALAACLAGALAGTSAAEPRAARTYFLVALSADGKHALLEELQNSGGGNGAAHYRVVAVDGGALEYDISLPAISALPPETLLDGGGKKPGTDVDFSHSPAAIAADLKAVAPLALFPLGAGNRIAVSADHSMVAFNAGDFIYTSKNGVIGKPLSKQASYSPWYLPDGSGIMFRMEHGLFPGTPEGNYELYTSPLDGSAKPTRIPGTSGSFEFWALAAGGKSIRMITNVHGAKRNSDKVCVVDVPLSAPFKATTKACLADGERLVDGHLSPHGTFGFFTTVAELDEFEPVSHTYRNGKPVPQHKERFRIRTLDVEKGTTELDDTKQPITGTAISDAGLLVIDRFRATVVIDSHARKWEMLPQRIDMLSAQFRNASELVVVRGDSVQVVDTAKWTQRLPWPGDNHN